MREDMKKVLTESPRYGHSQSYKEVRRRCNRGDPDNLPNSQGMRAPHVQHYGGKSFSDHIMPLIRYLWSNIGRKWDDVWSEICAAVPSGNTVDQHLKDHVEQEISLHCEVIDGEVHEKPSSRYSVFRGSKPRGLYVDPRDGIIKATAKDYYNSRVYRGKRLFTEITSYEVEDGSIDRIDGIWYHFDLVPVPPANEIIDPDTGKVKLVPVHKWDERSHCSVSTGNYYTNKRQLSSKELKKHGVTNI